MTVEIVVKDTAFSDGLAVMGGGMGTVNSAVLGTDMVMSFRRPSRAAALLTVPWAARLELIVGN